MPAWIRGEHMLSSLRRPPLFIAAGLTLGLLAGLIASPAKGIESVKARDGIINVALETRRLQLAIDSVVASPDARKEGFGQVNAGRMSLMASQVSDAYATKTRVDTKAIWNGSFLPPAAELNILPPLKK